MNPATFPYLQVVPAMGHAGFMPLLPISIRNEKLEVTEDALVDSGSTVNVLPYDLGVQLGLDWNATPGTLPLTGLMSGHPAKPVILEVVIGTFPALDLAFAWTQWPSARLILGQMNFFMEFDVCLFRSRGEFQIQPRTP